jgi:hypothetical protein
MVHYLAKSVRKITVENEEMVNGGLLSRPLSQKRSSLGMLIFIIKIVFG